MRVIIALIVTCVLAQQTVINLGEISDVIELNGEKQNQQRFYKVQIKSKVSDEDNLIVKVMTDDPFSDPNIFMSFSQQEPDQNSEFKCAAAGKDTCTLSGTELQNGLKKDKYVYIGVKCEKQCRYQIHPTLQKIVELQDNTELQLDFTPDESKLFKVKVPSLSELGGVQKDRITSLTILAAPLIQSATQSQADLILSATTDQKKSPGTSDIQGFPVWTQGKAIHLTEDSKENKLCTDCWVKILISVTKVGRYTIISKANTGEAQRAFESKVIYGVSQPGERTCYKYHIQDSRKTLDVRFKLFSGSSSQTIDPLEMPSSWNSSIFKFNGAFDSEISITPRMRKSVGHEDGLYYVCNFAHTLNSFSTIIREVDPDQDFTQLENGFVYSQEIDTSKQSFIYQVPRLDYSDEDIKISFYLEVTDGPLPKMAVRYCNKYQELGSAEALVKCGHEISQLSADDVIQRSKSTNDEIKFFWAKPESGLNVLQIILDHNEAKCDSKFNGKQQETKCFYQVVILAEEVTKYQLTASRFQANYEILRGSLPKVASVSMDEVRYFKFSLGATNYKALSFQLKTFHGDADLFVSREDQWPKGNNQADRVSAGEVVDRVDFESAKGALKGEYYVGVKGYQDSTFEIKVVLQQQDEDEWKLIEGNQLDRNYQLLIDGYPKEGELHNEGDQHKYRLVVDMEEGFERSIKIDVTNRNQDYNVKVFINFKREPNILAQNDLEFFSEGDKHIEIPVGSAQYHSKGTYYILIMPQNNLANSIFRYYFEDDYYRYQLKYSLEGSFEFLGTGLLTQSRQGANTKRFYRYIVEDRREDQRISLNMYEGTTAIKTEYQMEAVKNVDTSNHDGNIIYEGQSSTLIVSQQQLKKNCADELSPCIIYIGVKCLASGHTICQYSLKISDPNAGPEKLIVGTPIQDNVENDDLNYYYIVVTEEHVKDDKQINVVLNTLSGDADLYVKMQPNQNLIKRKDWVMPTSNDYDAKSELAVKQDIANVPSKLLKNCIKKAKQSEVFKKLSASGENEQAQCAILIGVKGKPEAKMSQYNLVAYVNLQILQSDRAAYGYTAENDYQYFTYQVNCDKCEVIIGVQDFSGGDPDLYINFGQETLPDKEKHDFKSTSFTSEIFILNLSDEYFKRHKIPSMKGTYTIGVFGKKTSSFEITATQNENRIITVQDSFRNNQDAYQTVFYQWYHKHQEDEREDIKIEITVNSGKVDVYINNYDHDFEQQNIVDRLPDSSRKAFYTLPNVKLTSQSGEGQLLIQAADANYCSNCWILIGVHSKDQESDYEIKISSLKADFQNSHFIKMGSPERSTVDSGQIAIFKFIIDEKEDVTIETTNHQGKSVTFVNSEPSIELDQTLESYANNGYVMLEVKNKKYQTGVLYYVIVKNVGDEVADFTIQISQDNSVIEIQNGVPLQVKFTDDQDITKNFAMALPKGQNTLTIQIQPLYELNSAKFEPFLYYKLVDNLGEVKDTIDFPPSGSGFGIKRSYEGNGFLQLSKKIDIDTNDKGVLFTVYMAPNRRVSGDNGEHDVMVFISTQQEKLLIEDQQMLESMFQNEQVEYIKLDAAFTQYQTGYTIIETSTCFGQTKTSFLKDPEDKKSQVRGHNYYDDKAGGRYIVSFQNPIPASSFYTVVESIALTDKKASAFRDGQGNRAQFMIKAYQSPSKITAGNDQKIKPSSSDLSYYKSETSPNIISVQWEPLSYTEVEYWVIVSTDTQANLESACVMNQDVYTTNNYKRFRTEGDRFDISVVRGQDTKINVAAKVLDGENRDEIFVYHQMLVNLPKEEKGLFGEESSSKGSIAFVLLFLTVAGIVAYLIIYKRHLFNFKTRSSAPSVEHHELGQYSMRSDVDYNPPQAYDLDDSMNSEEKYNIQ